MFVDKVKVSVIAGKGGDGAVSFRKEKFVDRGGPDGGDGGKGGDIVAIASRNQNTLASFRYHKELKAEDGRAGAKQKKAGRSGQDLTIDVPVGTVISTEDGEILADMVIDGQKETIARGGKGGFGNAHFVSSRRQAPKIAEKGEPGQEYLLKLELKTIADVGLVGLPNAGKSTLLSVVSNAHPEIADYPFTTLVPNLGVADIDKKNSLLIADIPGLIEGASQGKGLGDEFLRHIERTKLLVHLIDGYSNNISKDYETIQSELAAYPVDLTKRPQIVVINKIEGRDEDIVKSQIDDLKTVVPAKVEILTISAKSGQGVKELLFGAHKLMQKKVAKRTTSKAKLPVIRLKTEDDAWKVKKVKGGLVVCGQKIEKFALRTDYNNEAGVARLVDIMKKMGIWHEIERRGIKPGQKIVIGQPEIGRVEY